MAEIVVLALGAAVFPALLACVAILLSAPRPRLLLFAFYVGGLIVSISLGLVILNRFDAGEEVLGGTTSHPQPIVSIVEGLLGLALAWLLLTHRGAKVRRRFRRNQRRSDEPSRAERALRRANARIAFVVGAMINLPGPFYLLALGEIAQGDHGAAEELGLILLFNAIMFVLVELPLIGFVVRPKATERLVARLAAWLNVNGLRAVGLMVGLFGAGLLVQGLTAL